jgi:hypothetical protein
MEFLVYVNLNLHDKMYISRKRPLCKHKLPEKTPWELVWLKLGFEYACLC